KNSNMNTIRLLLITIFFLYDAQLLAQQKYQRIYFEADQNQLLDIAQHGVAIDHMIRADKGFQAELSDKEVQKIQQSGSYVKILIDDLSAYYSERLKNNKPVSVTRDAPLNFHLGSLGGNLTLQEMWDELDSMHVKFPSLITEKQPIGYSIENRPLYMVKIS